MTITKNPGRHGPIVAAIEVLLRDLVGPYLTASTVIEVASLTTATAYTTAIALPVGAVVVSGTVYVDKVFNSGTSDTLKVGDASDDDRYLADADLQALAPKPLVPTGFIGTAAEAALKITWTKVSTAPTQGRIRIELSYYVVADVVTQTVTVGYAALTTGTAYTTTLALPVGAVVIGGSVAINTAFNSGTSDVIVVGDATLANRYVASTDIHTGAATPIPFVPTGFVHTASEAAIKLTWTKVSTAPSAGSLNITVSYYVAQDLAVLNLPAGATVLSGGLTVTEAFNSGTSDTMGVGDSGSVARYKAQTTVASLARLALVPTGYKLTDAGDINVRWIRLGTTAPTTGKVRLDVTYMVAKRAEFSQE